MHSIKETMYSIKLDDTIVAVSHTIEDAMRAVQQLICSYCCISNPNCVTFPTGIQFHPNVDSAIADAVVNTCNNKETIRVFITKIEMV